MKAWRDIVRCDRGVAALEFAIVAPALLMVLGGLADFGLAFSDSMRIEQAAEAGATYAFAAQQEAGVQARIAASVVQNVVQASVALDPAATVTVEGPQAGCTQTDNSVSPPATRLTNGTYGQLCANGNPVGTYMVITVQHAFAPMMPFYSTLAATMLSASVTVRLY